MYSFAILLGAVLRWLFKGFRTSLSDELLCRLEPTWGKTYKFENYVVGVIAIVSLLGFIVIVFL